MRPPVIFLSLLVLAACSESLPEDQGEGTAVAIEKQIEGDAKSLEAAADEAVNVMRSKMEAELKADGFSKPVTAKQTASENQVGESAN